MRRIHPKVLFLAEGWLVLWVLAGVGCAGPSRRAAHPLPEPVSQGAAQEISKEESAPARVVSESNQATAGYHFSMAQAYSAEGLPERAIEEYRLAVAHDPSGFLYARMASEYVRAGKMSLAIEACKQGILLDPASSHDARMILGQLYLALKQPELALQQYNEILKAQPNSDEATIYRVQALLEANRETEALPVMEKFLQKNPDSVPGWFAKGRIHQKLQQTSHAEAAYRTALEIRPHFTQGILTLGLLYEETGRNAEAIKVYKEAYDQTQDLAAVSRLVTLLLKEERYADSLPYLEAIQAQDPEDLNAQVKLGLVYFELKRHREAEVTFQQILKLRPDSDRVRFYLGSLYEETSRAGDAIREFSQVPSTSKMYEDSILHAGYLLKEQKLQKQARELVQTALQKSPQSAGLHLFYASLLEESAQVPEAVRALETARTKLPQEERILYYLGTLQDKLGQRDQAIELMESILVMNPQHVDALNFLGYTWTLEGKRLQDAEKVLRRAMELSPGNAYIQDSWGWLLFTQGKTQEAVVELEKAAALKPDEATILDHLGDAYARMGLTEKAYAKYVEAAALSEASEFQRQVTAKIDLMGRKVAKGKEASPGSRSPASSTPAISPQP